MLSFQSRAGRRAVVARLVVPPLSPEFGCEPVEMWFRVGFEELFVREVVSVCLDRNNTSEYE